MDATALVETDFFATAVLETTRTPVKEVVKADMTTSIVFVPESDDDDGGRRTESEGGVRRESTNKNGRRPKSRVYVIPYVRYVYIKCFIYLEVRIYIDLWSVCVYDGSMPERHGPCAPCASVGRTTRADDASTTTRVER